MAVPPSWAMPASKVTRVRRLGFWKSIAMVRPMSAGRACRRVARYSALRVVAVANTRSISAADRSAALSRSRPRRSVMPPTVAASAPDGQVDDHVIPDGHALRAAHRALERHEVATVLGEQRGPPLGQPEPSRDRDHAPAIRDLASHAP